MVAILAVTGWRGTRGLAELREIERWANHGLWDRANAAIGKHLSVRPADAEVLLLAARVAAGRGDLERCWSLLARVPDDAPLKPEALTRQAQAAQALHSARRAEAAWRQLVRLTERDIRLAAYRLSARAELVSLLTLERRLEDAEVLLWQMYPEHREKWRVLIGLVRVRARGSTPKSPIELLERFIEHDPGDLDAARSLAMCMVGSFQWDRAAELAVACLEQEPSDVLSLEVLLECYLRRQQWEAMDEILARPELWQAGPRILRLRAQRQEAAGQLDAAADSLRQALQLDAMDPTTHFQLAQLLQRRGQSQLAQEHQNEFQRITRHHEALLKFIAGYPQSDSTTWTAPEPTICVEVAEHCRALGRIDEARAWLAEALRQKPEFPAASEALEQLK